MTKKLSEIAKEMAFSILRDADATPQAISVALQMTHIAWNFSEEEDRNDPGYIFGINETQELMLPIIKEFKGEYSKGLIEDLIRYKRKNFPDDNRTIFTCNYEQGKFKVTWR